MNEKINFERPEEKYRLPEDNIIALDKDSDIIKSREKFFDIMKEAGLDFPVEIQGSGRDYPDSKELKIWYPEGDIFISSAVTIHELGHWRQGEADSRFIVHYQGEERETVLEHPEYYQEMEDSAFQRGLDRIKKYSPETLEKLENKFQKYKEQGKLKNYNSFEDFYGHLANVIKKWTNVLHETGDIGDNEEKGRMIVKKVKGDHELSSFFLNQNDWRTGEMIDNDETKQLIKKVAINVAEEKY